MEFTLGLGGLYLPWRLGTPEELVDSTVFIWGTQIFPRVFSGQFLLAKKASYPAHTRLHLHPPPKRFPEAIEFSGLKMSLGLILIGISTSGLLWSRTNEGVARDPRVALGLVVKRLFLFPFLSLMVFKILLYTWNVQNKCVAYNSFLLSLYV